MQSLFVLLQAEHDTAFENLLTISLSMNTSIIFVRALSSSVYTFMIGKMRNGYREMVTEKCICKNPSTLARSDIDPPCRTAPNKLSPIFHTL